RRVVAAAEQPAVDLRMQGLDAAVEHLGEARVGRHLGDRDALAREQRRSAAGREDFHAAGREPAREFDDARLVRDAEERPLDLHPLIRSCCIFLRSVLRLMPSICAASDWLPSAWPSTVSIIGFSMFLSTMS